MLLYGSKKARELWPSNIIKRNLREIVLDHPLYSGLTPSELGFDVFDPTDSVMETIQDIKEVENEEKEENKNVESKAENKEIVKKRRGRKRKESPFIT